MLSGSSVLKCYFQALDKPHLLDVSLEASQRGIKKPALAFCCCCCFRYRSTIETLLAREFKVLGFIISEIQVKSADKIPYNSEWKKRYLGNNPSGQTIPVYKLINQANHISWQPKVKVTIQNITNRQRNLATILTKQYKKGVSQPFL